MTVDPESQDRTHGIAEEALERDLPPKADRFEKCLEPPAAAVEEEKEFVPGV